jgi:hypothetical protein
MPLFGPPNAEKLAAKRDVKGLIQALGYQKDWCVRRDAARALGQIGDSRAVEPLIAALNDADSNPRTAAAQALGTIGDVHAVEPLRAVLYDQNERVRQAAAWSLDKLGWKPPEPQAKAAPPKAPKMRAVSPKAAPSPLGSDPEPDKNPNTTLRKSAAETPGKPAKPARSKGAAASPAPARAPAGSSPAVSPPAAASPASPAPEPGADSRVVRVFVSSTFRDMGAERDELVKRTFPALRKLCESRGVTWGEVDLRWGITNEQRAEVLPICLAEIHRCRPYVIVLLGERYGWVPDALDPTLIEQERWLGDHAGRSVTELEILHGVLNDPAMAEHTFFYLRDPAYVEGKPPGQFRETPLPEELATLGPQEAERRAAARSARLAALKDRIRSGGLPVHEDYPDPRALGELVLADLSAVIERLYPPGTQPDQLTRETAEHEAFAASRAGVYIGRPGYFSRLDAHAAGDGPPLVVLGESGSGKSALLANWAFSYRKAHPDEIVLMHFIGASPASADWAAMLRRMIGELSRQAGFEIEIPDKPDALRLAFANALHMAAAKGRVVLVLDALNQLEDREAALDLAWLPAVIPATARIVLSTLPGRSLTELQRRAYPILAVEPLQQAERERLIIDYLYSYKKALDEGPRQLIASSSQCANPLYLRALLDELRLWGDHDTLPDEIRRYLHAESVDSLYGLILARYQQDYDRDRPGLVRDAFSLVWAARRGLSETELLDLLGTDGQPMPRAYWSPLYLAAEASLASRSGLLGFFHEYLRAAVEHSYLEDKQAKKAAHVQIADYFATRDIGPRKVDELPWQLAQASAWQRLADLLADLEFLEPAWNADSYEVKTAWARVEANSAIRLVDTYRPFVDEPAPYETSSLGNLAALLEASGHLEEALSLWETLADRFAKAHDAGRLQLSMGRRGSILEALGYLLRAKNMYAMEEQICRESGDRHGLMVALGNKASLAHAYGQLDEAMALYTEQGGICRETGDLSGLQVSLAGQAGIMRDGGQLDGAMALYKEQERICVELGHTDGLQASLGNQGVVLYSRREFDQAMPLFEEQERICREEGDKQGLQASLGNQGLILAACGRLDGALALDTEAERLCRELGSPQDLARILANQAVVLGLGMGRKQEALAKATEAHELALRHDLAPLVKQTGQVLDVLRQGRPTMGKGGRP